MSLELHWNEIALRLALTIAAGTLIGVNRSEHGQAAGLRTMILVCLAAAVAMIQVNLLLPMAGKAPDSFASLDLMRLPLGILTGMGFIGGGAILRRGNVVHGVTTAATLWIVTVIGLCLGGGQLALGLTTLMIALLALWALKWLEALIPQEQHAALIVRAAGTRFAEGDIVSVLEQAGYQVQPREVARQATDEGTALRIRFEISWRGHERDPFTRPLLDQIAHMPGVLKLRWKG
jgi:putative Mg2+ transporter-C (MgtC) family protein